MVDVQYHIFIHNGLEYRLEWAESRFSHPSIAVNFGKDLLRYVKFLLSPSFPDELFNRQEGLRCSSFRIKNLVTHGRKKMSLGLIKQGYIQQFNAYNWDKFEDNCIRILPQMADVWFKINKQLSDDNPGHGPILKKILELNENALATEVPIWTVTPEAVTCGDIAKSPYQCIADQLVTGHIDLILYSDNTNCLYIADYKPEGQFLYSLPQIAIYGLMMKRVLGYPQIKCVSFDREKFWVYEPEIIRTVVLDYLKSYGNPDLEWIPLLYSL